MITTTLPIEGTFDIARGRATLRNHIAEQHWPPTFNIRAAAALTALGELILLSEAQQAIKVKMTIIDENEGDGITFEFNVDTPEVDHSRLGQALNRLKKATDSLDIREIDGGLRLTAHVSVLERISR